MFSVMNPSGLARISSVSSRPDTLLEAECQRRQLLTTSSRGFVRDSGQARHRIRVSGRVSERS